MTELKYEHTDNGYCRVYYSWINSQRQKISYCIQDEGRGIIQVYRCSGDKTYDEPEYVVHPKDAPPLSPGDTETDKNVNEWITKKWG